MSAEARAFQCIICKRNKDQIERNVLSQIMFLSNYTLLPVNFLSTYIKSFHCSFKKVRKEEKFFDQMFGLLSAKYNAITKEIVK